ncbi:MAG: hypothetical protein R6U15_03750 [Candidatus Izemoplasmatales bacterium]
MKMYIEDTNIPYWLIGVILVIIIILSICVGFSYGLYMNALYVQKEMEMQCNEYICKNYLGDSCGQIDGYAPFNMTYVDITKPNTRAHTPYD